MRPYIPTVSMDDPIPFVRYIHGHTVRYDSLCGCVAEARGLFRWRYIAVGTAWFWLQADEQEAVLLHEVGHLHHHHLAKRIAVLPFFWTDYARRMGKRQEHEADAYAWHHGAGAGMHRFIERSGTRGGEFHPTAADRLARLREIA